MSAEQDLSELQLDALRELMNVGFGQAASALSEVIELRVGLTVPKISLLSRDRIVPFIDEELGRAVSYGMVEQYFFGRFEGASFLLLSEAEGQRLAGLFCASGPVGPAGAELNSLERDTVVEIGNIVIGACVGKIGELLRDQVSFHPPRYIAPPIDDETIGKRLGGRDGPALVFKTVFSLERQDILGHLFLVASGPSLAWIRKAVEEYIGSIS